MYCPFFAELSKLKCAKHGREMEKSEQKPSNKHQFDRLAFYFHFRFDKWKSPLIRQCHAHNLYLPLQSEFMTSLIMLLFGFIVTHICVENIWCRFFERSFWPNKGIMIRSNTFHLSFLFSLWPEFIESRTKRKQSQR